MPTVFAESNTGKFAHHADPEQFDAMKNSGKRLNVRSYSKLPNDNAIAEAWCLYLTPWTHGKHRQDGWKTLTEGKTYEDKERERRIGMPCSAWFKPLGKNDILRMLASRKLAFKPGISQSIYADNAIATKDGYDESWNKRRKRVASECVGNLRIDIDSCGYTPGGYAEEISHCEAVARAFGLLETSYFATGRRGFQMIVRLPRRVTTATACVLVDSVKKAIVDRFKPQGIHSKVDKDNVRSLMRLPLGPHAQTGELALFLDLDGYYVDSDEQVRKALVCFAPSESGAKIVGIAEELAANMHPDKIPSEQESRWVTSALANLTGLFAPYSQEEPQAVIGAVQAAKAPQMPPFTARHSGTLRAIVNRVVHAGATWDYLTHEWGVFAHVMVFGEDARDKLHEKMTQVLGDSATIAERLKTVDGLLKTFTHYGSAERKSYREAKTKVKDMTIFADHVKAGFEFAIRCSGRADRLENVAMVRVSELTARRLRPTDHLSSGDVYRVARELYGAHAPKRSTVNSIFWSDEYTQVREAMELLDIAYVHPTHNNIYSHQLTVLETPNWVTKTAPSTTKPAVQRVSSGKPPPTPIVPPPDDVGINYYWNLEDLISA